MNNRQDIAAFARKLTDLIMSQIEYDRGVNSDTITRLIETQIVANMPQAPDKHEVVKKAGTLQAALRDMGGVSWSSDVIDAYQALADALFQDRNGL